LYATLTEAVAAAARGLGVDTPAGVAVTAADFQVKDRAIAQYLAELLHDVDAQYVPVDRLGSEARGLVAPDGRHLDVLVRLFPLHPMCGGPAHGGVGPITPVINRLICSSVHLLRIVGREVASPRSGFFIGFCRFPVTSGFRRVRENKRLHRRKSGRPCECSDHAYFLTPSVRQRPHENVVLVAFAFSTCETM
jgi:hypothetical protein